MTIVAECRKRRLNQGSFVLLCSALLAFSALCLVYAFSLFLICLLSCIFQREWHCTASLCWRVTRSSRSSAVSVASHLTSVSSVPLCYHHTLTVHCCTISLVTRLGCKRAAHLVMDQADWPVEWLSRFKAAFMVLCTSCVTHRLLWTASCLHCGAIYLCYISMHYVCFGISMFGGDREKSGDNGRQAASGNYWGSQPEYRAGR